MQTLSHKRAIQWLDHLATIKSDKDAPTMLKNMKDNLRTLPTLILRHGLALGVLTGHASAPTAKQADWKQLNTWLEDWLKTQFPLQGADQTPSQNNDTFTPFVTQSVEQHGLSRYAALTEEALLFLEWGKQIITAQASEAKASEAEAVADTTQTPNEASDAPDTQGDQPNPVPS